MRSALSEILPTIGLGLLTIVAVIGAKQIFSGSSTRPTPQPVTLTSEPHDPDVNRRLERIEKAIKELRADVTELQKPSDAPSTNRPTGAESSPPPAGPPAGVADADNPRIPLTRGLDYVARGTYDDSKHSQILVDLAAAYAVPGLATEMNNALRTTIQQVNDIGTEHIITESRSLPRQTALEQLKIFLAMTPKLTPQQKARVNAVITAYQRSSMGR